MLGDVAESWWTDEAVQDISSLVEEQALDEGRLDPGRIEELVDVDEADKHCFAALLGLDLALESATLLTATFDQSALGYLTDRYLATGRLDTGAAGGAVLPRFVSPAQEHAFPEALRHAFQATVRVRPEEWDGVEHVNLTDRSNFGAGWRVKGLYYGCVPFICDRSEVSFSAVEYQGARMYEARLRDGLDVAPRIRDVLDALDRSDAAVGVLPELALTPPVLDAWLSAIRSTPMPRGSRLRWIFLGTGPLEDTTPPPNRGVLVDRSTGEVLVEQDKRHRFNLTPELIDRWGLEEDLGGAEPADEYVMTGAPVKILETLTGRFAVLICEDLSEVNEYGPLLAAFGVSDLLVPIFSQPIRKWRWETDYGSHYYDSIGTKVVVANSMAIPDPEPDLPESPVPSVAIAGSIALGEVEDCQSVAVFRFTEEGATFITL